MRTFGMDRGEDICSSHETTNDDFINQFSWNKKHHVWLMLNLDSKFVGKRIYYLVVFLSPLVADNWICKLKRIFSLSNSRYQHKVLFFPQISVPIGIPYLFFVDATSQRLDTEVWTTNVRSPPSIWPNNVERIGTYLL